MTAANLVISALRLIGGLSAGETPNADEAADGLEALITLVESWAGQEMVLYETALRSIALSTNIGPYDVPTARPIKVFGADVTLSNGLSFPVAVLGPQAFTSIEHQDPSAHTLAVMCDYAYPTAHVYVSPTPTGSSTLRLHCTVAIAAIADGTTVLALPPAYLKAIRFNLAVDLCTEFGRSCPPDVLRVAEATKGNLVALNGSNRVGKSQVEIPAIPAEARQ